ncbi:hypothetical protein [Aeromonas veronii]|uniref:hypothetical protein n=1 Tax=Aeromonas veronii TaxID=654 RepID=UPI001F1787A3|nr:hypothetical protein [Aeromonas veronii]MCF5914851.1 hypothetical protein [Aeromonas veronii]
MDFGGCVDNLIYQRFDNFNHADSFFDTLKKDYEEFSGWLRKKAIAGESAYVLYSDARDIDGFMYLKMEEMVDDVEPPLPHGRHLKIGTFKFNSKGSLRGQRFIKKALDYAIRENADDIYVTVFEKHGYLIKIFERYGFILHGKKETLNGVELVYVRTLRVCRQDLLLDYPCVSTVGNKKFLLAIYPNFHTKLFPDSILNNESADIVEDVSYTNSIHKIYICAMQGVMQAKKGDLLVIYRTSDKLGPARFRAVATSVCVVEDVRNIREFSSLEEFLGYCERFSVFSKNDLINMYAHKRYPYIIRFTYNIALPKRPTRGTLLDNVGLNENDYWGFMELTNTQFETILRLGEVDESLVIN